MDKHKRVCGRTRKLEDGQPEPEKKIYNVRSFVADTAYCHHFSKDNKLHCVHNNLDSKCSQICPGVMYVNILTKTMTCKPQKDFGGHNPCTEYNCPFVKEGKKCIFSQFTEKK